MIYNFSDYETQEKMLRSQMLQINHLRASEGLVLLDIDKALKALLRRIARHNGRTSNYTGSGKLRTV